MGQQIIAIEQLVPGHLETTDTSAAFGSVLMSRISSNLPVSIRVRGLPGWASYALTEAAGSIYCNGIRCGSEHCLVAGNGADLALICRSPAEVIVCRIDARPGAPARCQRETPLLADDPAGISHIRAMISSLYDSLDDYRMMPDTTLLHDATCTELRDRLAELPLASDSGEYLPGARRDR